MGTLGPRRGEAREIPSSALQAESHNSEKAEARCQAQDAAAELGTSRCSVVQTLIAQVTLAAVCDLGTTADVALLAVVGDARACTVFPHQVPIQRLHCTQEGKGRQAWLTVHPGSHTLNPLLTPTITLTGPSPPYRA